MRTFRITCKVENISDRSKGVTLRNVLVDTGSEYTCVPEEKLEPLSIQREKKDVSFVMANGQVITRNIGFASIRFDEYFTVDEVVFGQPGDLPLLGARSLEGMNLRVDPRAKKLVAAGPVSAA